MIFNRKILGVTSIAAKRSDPRSQLKSVRFEGNKAIATDGYLLIVAELPDVQLEMLPTNEEYTYNEVSDVSIDAESIALIARSIEKDVKASKTKIEKKNYAFSVKGEDGKVKIATINTKDFENRYIAVEKEPTEGEFVSWGKIANEDKPVLASVRFNIDLMIRMLQAMKKAGVEGSSSDVLLQLTDKNDPIVIIGSTEEAKEIKGVVMPMHQ